MSQSEWRLAQVNIDTARGRPADPVMAEFMSRLAELNGLAEGSAGFVMRRRREWFERFEG